MWKLVFAGSRFTSLAESRYHPGQGEALSVAWALHKARHYCLGNPDLVLAVDHKPLLKILGDKHMDDIDDPRILNLKEKTLRYSYRMVHVPGRKHSGPDATSRSPVSEGKHLDLASLTEQEVVDTTVRHLVAALRQAPTQEEEEDALFLEQRALGEAYSCLAALSLTAGQEEALQSNLAALSSPQVISWAEITDTAAADPILRSLALLVRQGGPDIPDLWPAELAVYFPHRRHLSLAGDTVVHKSRAVVPAALQPRLLDSVHSGHQGCTSMMARASQSVWWPGMSADIQKRRDACKSCDAVAPSQPAAPPHPLPSPDYPFQMISSDYFSYGGQDYVIINDRYSNFLSVYHGNTTSEAFIKVLREFCGNWGIPDELATDGATVYTSALTQRFLKQYGINHRVSSSYFPHSNQFSEGSVKAAKRMIRDNIGSDGKLNTDRFVRALLLHRNTPDRSGASPAQVVFGRHMKHFFPSTPSSLLLNPEWKLVLERRELALARRHCKRGEELTEHTRTLSALSPGQVVLVQNQQGNRPKRWDRTGLIVEVKQHDQYLVRMDGSGRASLRNRRFLRPTTPHSSQAMPALDPPTSPPGLLLTTEPECANPSTPPAPRDSPALAPCVELPEEPAVPVCLPAAQEEGQEQRKEEEGQERGKKEQVQQEITRSSPRRTKRIRKSTQLAPGMIYYY